ncbi:MAG: flagellar export chaperone FliS [Candidatus Abyssobacteria bacterium SURF_17]|uniref:Flagellar export chaperone FliS n=1 Tax=Candidatus Abyssobacteria bacterium SURF_17 TaxID=2093361 RepID=A0A419F2P8_9BACT|nr:MAG: flagellar export chaperone FliS [Candidatus Abyssubacteria bacterium SURF_17]
MDDRRKNDTVHARAAKCYREEHVNGLSQKELILMLYDGAIKFSSEAKEAIERKDFVQSYKCIVKARDIVAELLRILDVEVGGEVAQNLQRLYVYMIGRLIEVNFTKETRLIDNVVDILRKLRSAWAEIDFQQALASLAPADGQPGRNGEGYRPVKPRSPATTSRLLSVTV